MEDTSSCCFNCRWQVTCNKHTVHTLRKSKLYPGRRYIDSCEQFEPMFLTKSRLAKLCGVSLTVITRFLSKGDDYAVSRIKERFGIEIQIVREPEELEEPVYILLLKGSSAK